MTKENIERLLATVRDLIAPIGVLDAKIIGEREVEVQCLSAEGHLISHFDLSLLPGCRYVMVFHKVSVMPEYRNQGVGKLLHRFRLDVAKAFGSTLVVCTTLDANSVENRILREHGWTPTATGTPGVSLWSKALL